MANTRVKVPRLVLIERIQESIDKATKEHAARVSEFEAAKAEVLAKLPGELERIAKEISSFSADESEEFVKHLQKTNYAGDKLQIRVDLRLPKLDDDTEYYNPRRGRPYYDFLGYISTLEKSKRVLEASTEELISVAANDEYADYL